MKYFHSLLFVVLVHSVLLCCSSVYAQQYFFRNYGIKHGLPQSEIPTSQAVVEDLKGRIWVGTNGGGIGLLEQDKYRVFDEKDGLNSNLISAIAAAPDSSIWILSQNRSISNYDGKAFTSYPELEDKLSVGGRVAIDEWNNVWVLAFGGGEDIKNILYWKPNNQKTFRKYNQIGFQRTDLSLISLKNSKKFQTYITYGKDIFVFNGQEFEKKEYPKSISDSLNTRILIIAHQDYQDNHWIWSSDKSNEESKLFFYNNKTKNAQEVRFPKHLIPDGFSPVSEWQVLLATDNKLYISAHLINKVFVFEKNNLNKIKFLKSYSKDNGLEGILAESGVLFEDFYGTVWVAAHGEGLIRLPKDRFTNFTPQEGLEGNVIFSVLSDKQNRVWVGSYRSGITLIEEDKIDKVSTVLEANSKYGRISAFWNYQDTMYAASAVGILKITENKYTKTFAVQNVNRRFGLDEETYIRNLVKIDNILWICMQTTGLVGYDLVTKKVKYRFTKEITDANSVMDIAKDSKGNYWLATFNGLIKWDGKGTSETHFKRYSKKEGLGDNLLLQLHIDARDVVWIVAYTGGLNRFDGEKFQIYQTAQGLSSNLVYSILPVKDKLNEFWIGTQRGLNKLYLKPNGEIINIEKYTKEDGLFAEETNGKAIHEDLKGNIWLGHIKGISRCNFSDEKKYIAPHTFITELNLFLEQTNWKDSTYIKQYKSLSAWNHLPQNLELEAEQNKVNFSFYTANLSSPQDIEYQWQLVGSDKEWLAPTQKTEANYSNLSAGKYIFEVRSRVGKDEQWGEISSFAFQIHPHWWQTLGVKIGVVFLIFGLSFWTVRFYTASLKRSKTELENIVNKRTIEVVKQKDEILEKNNELETQQQKLEEAYTNIQEKNNNITASITYAKRIQDAMMPSEEDVCKYFSDCFVFYKPRDIVSGDFYWVTERENKIIIAAVDCTGHGVPGAFMSVIGNNLLYETVKIQGITSPAKILDTLNESVRRYLNQNRNRNRDGMDMSICSIDKNTKTLTFAGAKNPLLHIYDNQIVRIRGDRYPIGGFNIKQEPFKEHIIEIKEDSIFYMYSDGFQDQFGGPQGTKYMSKRFQNFLKDISTLPAKQQKRELKKELREWQFDGHEKQIDDILVIGFKL
ncbi:SpoIIE family protein phosphatase (plasmid) [Bernardetia sp. Wsw4-3y2]|uniref:SpoIIE family protein phosphatase n=1 Tax=Bernardetia sp. Wsw4-3y2 TaxID=3127471 RepID=UPI0030D121B1